MTFIQTVGNFSSVEAKRAGLEVLRLKSCVKLLLEAWISCTKIGERILRNHVFSLEAVIVWLLSLKTQRGSRRRVKSANLSFVLVVGTILASSVLNILSLFKGVDLISEIASAISDTLDRKGQRAGSVLVERTKTSLEARRACHVLWANMKHKPADFVRIVDRSAQLDQHHLLTLAPHTYLQHHQVHFDARAPQVTLRTRPTFTPRIIMVLFANPANSTSIGWK